MPTGPVDLSDLLRLPGIVEIAFADAPSWLWDIEAGRIAFANASGVAFFRHDRLADLQARRFDMGRPGLAPLASAETNLPRDGTPRLLMLRYVIGSREVAVACRCRLAGQGLVLVTAAGGGADGRPLKARAAVLFDDLDLPVAVLQGDEPVYRNPAAQSGWDGDGVALAFEWRRCKLHLQLGIGVGEPAGEEVADHAAEPQSVPATARDVPAKKGPPGSGSTRMFSFVLDAEGRFVEVGPALADAVGPRFADLVGRYWADVAQTLGLDPQGAVSAALRSREAWSGIVLDWPSDDGLSAEVHMAAQPRFADGGVFIGYRGFGDVVAAAPQAEADLATPPVEVPPVRSPVGSPGEPLAHRPGQGEARLNDAERVAFQTIAEALGAFSDVPAHDDDEAASVPQDTSDASGSPADDEPVAAARHAPEGKGDEDLPEPPAFDEGPGGESGEGEAAWPIVARILDRLPSGIAIMRGERILFANAAFLETFGYTDLDDLEIAGGADALFEGVQGGVEGTVVARSQDGTQITVDSRLGRLDWVDGPAMFVTARQLPQAPGPVRSDAEIAELRAILDTATDGLLVLSGEGRVEAANRSAEALLGCDVEDIKGRTLTELVAEPSRGAVGDYLARLAAGGVGSLINDGCEIVARARGGEVVLFLTMGRIGDETAPRFSAVVRDLTEWKAAEAEMVAARQRAEAANAQKSDFLAKISHEIRTPLNAIIGFAEVMLEERFGPVGSDRYREYIKDMRASGEHIMSLVNDLLDLSKVEAGRLELNFTNVNLNDIVEQSVAIMQPQANSERVIIRASLARGLPPVVADTRSMRQVMLNLLSNAIKFTPPGGQAFVSTALGSDGAVTLRVRDTGIGMSEGDIETALEPFRQVAVGPDDPNRGTGLGLPLTRALVEANRAGFAIRSRINEGTLVEVSFPPSRVLVG